jgi:hypothetical protein
MTAIMQRLHWLWLAFVLFLNKGWAMAQLRELEREAIQWTHEKQLISGFLRSKGIDPLEWGRWVNAHQLRAPIRWDQVITDRSRLVLRKVEHAVHRSGPSDRGSIAWSRPAPAWPQLEAAEIRVRELVAS